jgi:hypothetical protein
MRVLFFLEPLVMHSRPFHYWAWLGIYADMLKPLLAAGHEVRLITNEALAERAVATFDRGGATQKGHGIPAELVIALPQMAVRQFFGRPNVDIIGVLHRREDDAAIAAYGACLREWLADFRPDVMLALLPAPQLTAAFPEALLLHTETGAYSRPPFPFSMFFDPAGCWERSLLARVAGAAESIEVAPAEAELLSTFRRRYAAFFAQTSPFHALEAELRAEYAQLAFLPLQFGGEPGFDLNASFRNQGEYLLHVVEQLPAGTALLVVEHPTAHWIGDVIDEETRGYLAEFHPEVRFLDFRSVNSAGQYLVHHVDYVISVSTSLALQALFFGRPVVSVGHSHVAALAQVRGIENVPRSGPLPAPSPELERVLAWMLARYFVPVAMTRDPAWLSGFFRRSVERARGGELGPRFFDAVFTPEHASLLFAGLEGFRLRAELQNGNLTRWSAGPGPFAIGAGAPDGFHVVDLGGGVGTLSRSSDGAVSALRLERSAAGRGPTLVLQRIPDLTQTAGTLARLSFRARSTPGADLGVYFYLQPADGESGFGTSLQRFRLTPEWQDFSYGVALPALGERQPGPGNHLELVFALGRDAGAATLELSTLLLESALD